MLPIIKKLEYAVMRAKCMNAFQTMEDIKEAIKIICQMEQKIERLEAELRIKKRKRKK